MALGARAYEVVIGAGASRSLAAVLPPGVQRAVVVCPEGLAVEVDPGVPCERVVVPDGEGSKVLGTVETLCRRFAQAGLSRQDAVVAVGGGVVSDLVGFAASVYLRGIAYVNVPTTLLAQVDAAVGGKTGVNLPEGKNLVGTFWQPAAVLCDTDLLATLPPREWSSGRGEMAKYAFLDAAPGSGPPPSPAALLELPLDDQVAWCVGIKAAVVAADEREGDRRMVLNYGHTLAHALEADALGSGRHDDLRHGEAVAVGLVFAARLAHRLGRIDEDRVELHRRVVAGFDLSTELPDASATELLAYMARDKKARHDLTFVLDGPEGVVPVRGVDAADVLATLAEMGARP